MARPRGFGRTLPPFYNQLFLNNKMCQSAKFGVGLVRDGRYSG
jgi:hypothetical protein